MQCVKRHKKTHKRYRVLPVKMRLPHGLPYDIGILEKSLFK